MTLSDIFEQKNIARDKIKMQFDLPKRNKSVICILMNDIQDSPLLGAMLEVLPANFLIVSKNKLTGKNYTSIESLSDIEKLWIDAIMTSCSDISIESYMKLGVVPIINENNYLWKILSEFSAAKGEGNAYLYEDKNFWSAYYALIRYLENMKFPYDNRNLVKNVVWM